MQQEHLELLIEVLVLFSRAASHMDLLQRLVLNIIFFVRHHKVEFVSLALIVVAGFVLELI